MCCLCCPVLSSVQQGLSSFWTTWKMLPKVVSFENPCEGDEEWRGEPECHFSCTVPFEQETVADLTWSPPLRARSLLYGTGSGFRGLFAEKTAIEVKNKPLLRFLLEEKREAKSVQTPSGAALWSHTQLQIYIQQSRVHPIIHVSTFAPCPQTFKRQW